MEPLSHVSSLLRYNKHHDLAGLLANACVEFDVYDLGFALTGDGEFDIANAIIYAPVSSVNELRSLSEDDKQLILEAMQEIWPCSEGGGLVIRDISFQIDKDSLGTGPLMMFDLPAGWERVRRSMSELRIRLTTASREEDFQQLGLLSREILISLAQAVYDPDKHSPLDRRISTTDMKGMMDGYLAVECSGSGNEQVRKCARSTFELANAVQHDRNATYREAALCVQAVFNLVGLIEIVSGERDRAI